MKVLSFGHIPVSVGGRQCSGLANVIYQLAYNCANIDDLDMTLAATDVYVPELKRDNLMLMGWTKCMLVKHVLRHPLSAIKLAINTLVMKNKYSPNVSIPGHFIKSIFLDYAIKKIRPDALHLHGVNSISYFNIIPKDIKLVVTLHGNVGCDKNLPNVETHAKMEADLCASPRIDALCTITSTIPLLLREQYGSIKAPVHVILNAYDNKAFKIIEPVIHDKLTLCTIGSLSKLKGQERVIEALIQSSLDYKYICIGYALDKDKSIIEQKAKGLDFEWLGVKSPSEIRTILAFCDYMILPSSTEGFGLVYLEAIACGVPVIIPECLPLAKEGEILNKKNSIRIKDSSSDAICSILPLLSKMTWNHKEVSESVVSYTWENIANEYCNLYKSII